MSIAITGWVSKGILPSKILRKKSDGIHNGISGGNFERNLDRFLDRIPEVSSE